MPSPQLMKQLADAMEANKARMAAALASAPPGEHRDTLLKLHGLLRDTHGQLEAAVQKLNQDVAAAIQSGQQAAKQAEAKAAERLANAPRPKPRPAPRGPVADPHLEEKLQLALRTPFGNRGQ
jgi:hypothetical protein